MKRTNVVLVALSIGFAACVPEETNEDAPSYGTTDAGGAYAWTYVSGNVEYWAMDRLIPTVGAWQSPQAPFSPPYTSFGNFVGRVCAMAPPPTEWLTQSMVAQPAFCSTNPC